MSPRKWLGTAVRRARRRQTIAIRGAFLSVARRFTPLVAVEARGALYLVETHDTSFGPTLFTRRARKELRVLPRVLEVLAELGALRSGATLIDVGAHVGTTTIAALDQGFARAVAIEPEERNHRLLLANLALNGLDERVTAIRAAASSSAGSALLAVGTGSRTKPRVLTAPPPPDGAGLGEIATVATTTLDALAAAGAFDAADVALLWMDAEGHEGHVLAGATGLLRFAPPIVSELNLKLLDRPEALRPLLEAHYTHVLDVRELRSRRLRPIVELDALIERYRPSAATDVLFLRLPS